MLITNDALILKDYNDEITPLFVKFKYPIDLEQLKEDIDNLKQQEGWAYNDLTKILDAYGEYEAKHLNEFYTIMIGKEGEIWKR